ncbi:MAG: hypothetical protein A2854_02955 [Parcubacteria group bacterium RIFCSPHIGHO2_01_FULL_56_18]|nr:MAG: hypothetical protein A2854_02955 [Parcubacteria group bacterium RIFCSPHIGHO2_01_FULL_56_18]
MRFDTDIQVKLKDAYAARHEPEAIRLLARAYWAFLILGLTFTVITVISYGVWEFFRMPTVDAGTSGMRPQTAFTRAQLQELLDKFDARAEKFQERMTAPVSAKDPS